MKPTKHNYVSEGNKQGTHWTLLAIDFKNTVSYYGDSLGWPFPDNIENTVVPNLRKIEQDIEISIIKSMENLVIINKMTNNTVNGHSHFFYPIQSCSNVCGIVVICMAAALCDKWNTWLTWNNQVLGSLLSNPTMNNNQLRLIVLSWIVNNHINVIDLVHDTIAFL